MSSIEPSGTDSEALRPKQIAFAAMGGGVAAAMAIFAAITPVGDVEPAIIEILFYAAAATAFLGVIVAYAVQQRLMEALDAAGSDDQAVDILFRRSIFSAAAVELPAMLGLVGFLLSGDGSFLAFTVPFFVVLGLLFPTPDRVRQRMHSVRPRG